MNRFNKRKKGQFKEKQLYVLDTETWGLRPNPKYLAFGILYGQNYKFTFYNKAELLNELDKHRFKNAYIFAHNAEYDLQAIFGNIFTNFDSQVLYAGSRFISARHYNKFDEKITFCDSMNIYPMSVDKVGTSLGTHLKGQTPEKFIKGIKTTITKSDIDYCKIDCQIIFLALKKIFIKTGAMRMTIASISLNYFQTNFLDRTIFYESDITNNFFDSYFGGRTEIFKIGSNQTLMVYDINSMYSFIMRYLKLPKLNKLKQRQPSKFNLIHALNSEFEGLTTCTVQHKKTYFGYLPYKLDNRLVFPTGKFSGTWNLNELRFAYESGVIEILDCTQLIHSSNHIEPLIFNNYVSELYNERKNETNELNKLILKLLLNSLYGKFGQRQKTKTEYFPEIPIKLIEQLEHKGKRYEIHNFNKERQDLILETELEKPINTKNTIATIASYITSTSRIMLLKSLLEHEKTVSYCDTDSIFISQSTNKLELSDKLGAWKLENKTVTNIKALKVYDYTEDGIEKQAIKGVSRNATKISENNYQILKYYKSKQALRQNKETGSNYMQTKKLTLEYTKRIVLKDGFNTLPIHLS